MDEPPADGRESVWDYPRPPRLVSTPKRIIVRFGGEVVADTTAALRILETSHPPVYYLPPSDVRPGFLRRATGSSFCEWKGGAVYFDVTAGGKTAAKAAWSYPDPVARYAALKDHVAFYAGPMDECTVDGEVVTPQPGGFYGGWITKDLVGPFKGAPGTVGW
ncbi:MAG: DUF427 domain-containing protein [Planctomycetia bacterium]